MKSFAKYSIIFTALIISITLRPALSLAQNASDAKLNVPIPGLEDVKVGVSNSTDNSGNKAPDLEGIKKYLNAIYRYGLGLGALMAILRIAYAAIKYSTSGGNSGSQGEAMEIIKDSLWGLGLLLLATLILNVINPKVFTLDSGSGGNAGSRNNSGNTSNQPPSPPPAPPLQAVSGSQSGPVPTDFSGAPGNLVNAPGVDPNKFYFSWKDNASNETKYEVYEITENPTAPLGIYETKIGEAGPQNGGNVLVGTSLTSTPGTARRFVVYAYGPDGQRVNSQPLEISY